MPQGCRTLRRDELEHSLPCRENIEALTTDDWRLSEGYLELKNILNLISPTSLYFYMLKNICIYLQGNSLVVQWLGLSAFSVGDCIASLVGELGSQKPQCGQIKKTKTVKCVPHTYFLKALYRWKC